jgi:hypothetical protein
VAPVRMEVIGPEEVLEGLKSFADMCAEHVELLGQIAEARRLMAPENPEDWPTYEQETLVGALRNRLQSRMLAMDAADRFMDLLETIADELGFPRMGDDAPNSWSAQSLLAQVRQVVQGEREALRFRRELIAILGLTPGSDPLEEIKRLNGGTVLARRNRLDAEFRADLKAIADTLDASAKAVKDTHTIVLSKTTAVHIANTLRIIRDSTVDA